MSGVRGRVQLILGVELLQRKVTAARSPPKRFLQTTNPRNEALAIESQVIPWSPEGRRNQRSAFLAPPHSLANPTPNEEDAVYPYPERDQRRNHRVEGSSQLCPQNRFHAPTDHGN